MLVEDLATAGDPAPVSTPELLRYVAAGLDVPARLFFVPLRLLESLCRMAGRADLATKLLWSLEFETADSFAQLAWWPGTEASEGIVRAVRAMKF